MNCILPTELTFDNSRVSLSMSLRLPLDTVVGSSPSTPVPVDMGTVERDYTITVHTKNKVVSFPYF